MYIVYVVYCKYLEIVIHFKGAVMMLVKTDTCTGTGNIRQ